MELKINGEMMTVDVKDKFLIITENTQNQKVLSELRDRVVENGGLGVISFEDKADVKTLEPEDKLLIVKCDTFNKYMMEELRKQLYNLGCLGVINLPEDSKLESLGVKQLQNIVDQIKSMRQEGVKDE